MTISPFGKIGGELNALPAYRPVRAIGARGGEMSYRAFDVSRVAGALGAEISGIDLARPLDDAVIAEIRRALLDHQVIFFRDQHLTPEQHLAFGRRFGDLNVHDFVAG